MSIKDAASLAVPLYLNDEREHRRLMAQAINETRRGALNVTGQITLRANQTTTTLVDSRIGAYSFIEFMAETATAAAAKVSIWVNTRKKGEATINHASNAATDQTFTYAIVG